MKKLLSILFLFSLSLSAQVSKNRLMTTGYGWKNRVVPTNAYLDSTFSSFWMPEGNSVGTNNPIVGTLNNKPLYFVTNSLTAVVITTSQAVGIGVPIGNVGAQLTVKGSGSTNSTYAAKFTNSSDNTLLDIRDDQKVYIKTPSGWPADVTLGVGGAVQMYGFRSRGIHRINYGNNDIQLGDSRPNIEWDNSVDGQVFITGIKNDDTWGIFCKGASDYGFQINRVTRNVGLSADPINDAKLYVKGTMSVSSTATLNAAKINNTLTVGNTSTLTGGNSGTLAVLSDNIIQLTFMANGGTMADGASLFIGNTGYQFSSSSQNGTVTIPANYELVSYNANFVVNGTIASAETATLNLRVNSTYTTLTNAITLNDAGGYNNFSGSLSGNLSANDRLNVRITLPTYVTNPTNVFCGVTVFLRRRL